MSVAPGQNVSASVVNGAFVSRIVDTNTVGRLDLENILAESGASVFNIQRALNGLASFSGSNPNGVYNQLPSWTNNDVGAPSDDVKTRADNLTAAVGLLAGGPQWTNIAVSYLDIAAAATTFTLSLGTLNANEIIQGLLIKHSLEFTGGSVSAITAALGISGEFNRYTEGFDIFAAPTSTDFELIQVLDLPVFGAGTQLELQVDSVGGNLDALIQGDLNVYLLTSQLP